MLAVADIEEGVDLRKAGVRAPILVFGALSVSDLDGVFDHELTPTISSPAAGAALQAAAREARRIAALPPQDRHRHEPPRVQARQPSPHAAGTIGERQPRARRGAHPFRNRRRAGQHVVRDQRARFEPACADSASSAPARGCVTPPIPPRCCATHASGTTSCGPACCSTASCRRHWLDAGAKAGHVADQPGGGREGCASWRNGWLRGTLSRRARHDPGGHSRRYADGLDRRLEGTGLVLIRGRRAPIVGAVSMDMLTADVTDIDTVGPGDEVVLIGSQGRTGSRPSMPAKWRRGLAPSLTRFFVGWEHVSSASTTSPRTLTTEDTETREYFSKYADENTCLPRS